MSPHFSIMMKQVNEMLKRKMNISKLSFSYMDYLDSEFQVSQMLYFIYCTLASVACHSFLLYLLVQFYFYSCQFELMWETF